MNTIPRAGWVPVLLLVFTGLLSAQKTTLNEDLVRADRQYDLYAYNLAMQTYQQVLKSDPGNAHALARVGDCYFQLNEPEKSIEWYKKAVNQFGTEEDLNFRYAMALLQVKDYLGAREQFLNYSLKNDAVGSHYAAYCEYASLNIKKETVWQVKNEALNTAYADFCPSFLGSRVVYSSSRTDITSKTKSSVSPSGSQNYLLISQRDPRSDLLQKPILLRSELQNGRNEGPASFSANGRRVAFCRNNFINGTRQIAESGINMSLYVGDVDENGQWKNIKPFPYNGSNYATGFPSLSPDGNTLIFASTQPGGLGGWDIYVSNFNNGTWSAPRNLGSPLNTPGNEVTPYFDGTSLYFSSDWHNGFGGLDVFRAELGAEAVSNVYHLGTGVNSERDDYGFIYNSTDNVGYLTSTRSGGRGNEDIWMVTKKWEEPLAVKETAKAVSNPYNPAEYNAFTSNSTSKGDDSGLYLLITDERDNRLPGAEVDLSDCYGEKGFTDNTGKFNFLKLTKSIDCQVQIKKAGFRDASIKLSDFGQQVVRVALTPETRQRFNGRVYDAQTNAPVRGVGVQINFEDGSNSLETVTDEEGGYTLFLDPGSSYLVNYSKYGYEGQISKTYFGFDMAKVPNVMLTKTSQTIVADAGNTQPIVYSDNSQSIKTVFRKKEPEPVTVEPVAKLTGYSIQLGAMPDEPSNYKLGTYESLTKEGNLYVKKENSLYKIRLGIFKTKEEAQDVLKKVQASNIQKDAFVVAEYGADESLIVGYQEPVQPTVYSTEPSSSLASRGETGSTLYALQLGSFASDKAIDVDKYIGLRGLGNLYSNSEMGSTQVRLGIWKNQADAEKALVNVKTKGFPEAFIVTEKGSDPDIQDFIIASTGNTEAKKAKITGSKGVDAPAPVVYSTTKTDYYIRLAALANPERFDGASLSDIGPTEQRTSDTASGLTLILISGFATDADANAALEKVVRRGYQGAYVVKEEDGVLIRQ
ncbi:MAG: SPOR domain-containing protein [Lewinellaceae bacterium]|nr:SPOR domain-containing protein [Saprospiraceae bacterium]MCB9342135.1 SPOR domain-containing protein [Lewinellaceae bacterium]